MTLKNIGVKPKRSVRGIRLFTVKDIAKILDLSIISARLYLKEGHIPGAIKIGGTWHISNKNLDRWLTQSSIFTKPEAKLIEGKVIGNIEGNLEKIRIKQELLKKSSAPKYAVDQLQKRIEEIEKSLKNYKESPIS